MEVIEKSFLRQAALKVRLPIRLQFKCIRQQYFPLLGFLEPYNSSQMPLKIVVFAGQMVLAHDLSLPASKIFIL
jgi:hypothetical protein